MRLRLGDRRDAPPLRELITPRRGRAEPGVREAAGAVQPDSEAVSWFAKPLRMALIGADNGPGWRVGEREWAQGYL